jgi:hypothetical protein
VCHRHDGHGEWPSRRAYHAASGPGHRDWSEDEIHLVEWTKGLPQGSAQMAAGSFSDQSRTEDQWSARPSSSVDWERKRQQPDTHLGKINHQFPLNFSFDM